MNKFDYIHMTCKCGYEWPYRGSRKEGQFVTCPACHKTIKIGGGKDGKKR